MPRSFLENVWALNPWAAEPARDAAQAPSLRDFLPPIEEAVVLPPSPPPTKPRTEITYETDDWFQSLRRNWETKPPVIPPEKHVSKRMLKDVTDFVNRREPERTKIHCFDYALYQMHLAKFRTGGRPSLDPRSLQILVEYIENGRRVEEVQLDAAIEAVLYIKEALHQNIPVLVGICLRNYMEEGRPARPNEVKSTPFIEPTNHYVVIVGMDSDNKDVWFRYYDYQYSPETPLLHLHLKPTMKLESYGGDIVLAEVRRSMPR